MSRFPLEISHYVSSALVVVGPSESMSEAIRKMRSHGVRHLPVLRGSKVIGIVSQRDVYRMQSIDATKPTEILVSEVMTPKPYTVEPDERIDLVAREMVRRKIGTAVVTHGDELLGLFTSTDALLAIAALIEDEEVAGEPVDSESAPRAVKVSKRQRKTPRSKPAAAKAVVRARRARASR